MAHGLYLLLVLYTTPRFKRVWKHPVAAFWYVHVGGPLLPIALLVVPHVAPRHGTPLYWLHVRVVHPFRSVDAMVPSQAPGEPQIEW